jgi:hypothetical protein
MGPDDGWRAIEANAKKAQALGKRVRRAYHDMQGALLRAQVLRGETACVELATALNWLDAAATELERVK